MTVYIIQDKNLILSGTDFLIKKCAETYFREHNIFPSSKTEIVRSKKGKPFLNPRLAHISAAHTSDTVLIAFSGENIGIDIESEDRNPSGAEAIAQKRFSKAEQNYITDFGKGFSNKRFIEIWVKKEAYLKFTGEGLSGLKNADIFSLKGKFYEVPLSGHVVRIYSEHEPKSIEISLF